MRISLVAAMAKNRVIGNGPDIPWRIPGEQKIFRRLTEGGIVAMGRKTFESIGRTLPNRETVVITRQPAYIASGCTIVTSFEAAVERRLAATSSSWPGAPKSTPWPLRVPIVSTSRRSIGSSKATRDFRISEARSRWSRRSKSPPRFHTPSRCTSRAGPELGPAPDRVLGHPSESDLRMRKPSLLVKSN